MITFNEAKQMLDQRIFPCLNNDGHLDYIIKYNENDLKCDTLFNTIVLFADSTDGELYIGGKEL